MELFASVLCHGLKVLHLILDHESMHAPKQLGGWIASLQWGSEVRLYWLPTHVSWSGPKEKLSSDDFPSTIALNRDLMAYFAELNRQLKPIQWTYTKAKLIAKFDAPSQGQLAV